MSRLTVVQGARKGAATKPRGLLFSVGRKPPSRAVNLAGVRFADFVKTLNTPKEVA